MAARSRRSAGRRLLAAAMRLVAYGTLLLAGMWLGLLTAAFPQLDELEQRAEFRQVTGAVLARDGRTVLRRLRAPETRTYVEPSALPSVLVDAVVAAEDRRFFQHSGIDPRGIARALVQDVRARSTVEGGSTITQQLVKNTYVGSERSLARKSREAVLAMALESRWSKRRILAAYLNTAYFGNGLYGVADAARGYFNVRDLADLKPSQAALLAGLLRAPEGSNPVSAPDSARAERSRVLDAMVALDKLSAGRAARARAAALPDRVQRGRRIGRELAPQFTDAIVGTLIERYGVRRALGGGLRVRTTIDADMQRAARTALEAAGAAGLDAALVAIDPRTGEVRAMANGGSATRAAFNVALDGQRQPGSAFKPFMLAAAYEAGYAPRSAVLSAPFDEGRDTDRFQVKNAGGYAGRTTLERATWQSDNTVYARLQHELGIQPAIDMAAAAGIRSRMDPVPALVLGALPQGTTPTELAHAYATFAAHGSRTAMVDGGGPRMIDRVTQRGGGERWRPTAVRRDVMDRGIADLVTATLQGVVTQGTGTAAAFGRPAAGKTGTTEQYRDAWFVGYTPQLAVAVWVGRAEGGVPMLTQNGGGPVTGGSIPARIWSSFMQAALADQQVAQFELETPTYETVRIDPESGLLAGLWCAGGIETTFITGKAPTETATGCRERQRPVPDLVGMPVDEARTVLQDEEFARPSIEDRLVSRGEQHDVVLTQEPAAGTNVFRDEPITLTVGDFPFER